MIGEREGGQAYVVDGDVKGQAGLMGRGFRHRSSLALAWRRAANVLFNKESSAMLEDELQRELDRSGA